LSKAVPDYRILYSFISQGESRIEPATIKTQRTSDASSAAFIAALEQGNFAGLRTVAKSDLHNHWLYGGTIRAFEKRAGHQIEHPPKHMDTIKEMVDWARANLKTVFQNDYEYHMFALESSFRQALSDGVTVLEMSVDVAVVEPIFPAKPHELARSIRETHERVAPGIRFVAELGIKGGPNVPVKFFEACLDTGYFGSVDLYGVEDMGGKYGDYKDLYRKAGKAGLKLKAHVGEFGGPELVREAVETLELSAVQHGISAARSPEVMRWLAGNKIQLNVCPSSNVVLKRVPSIKEHPIRPLFDNGVLVTVNTDDLAIFNQSVSDEYRNLFTAGLFSAKELDKIRRTGLRKTHE
jgi:hypothetical protein